ncbi:MAG: ABC transporter ATP-binding protein [Clostridiaceae bacterium]|nr:ABC transporter ATP-binding protein [Clostridiaceae bacterium]
MKKSIEVKDIAFKYNDEMILKKLNVAIKENTFISIIGPNGSGKSTLLKTIARNLLPQEGAVFLKEKNLQSYSAKDLAKEMAVVPQTTEVNYNFTVEDIVLMGRHPHIKRFKREGVKDFEIVKEAMELTNTWHLRDRFINEISGGERQRAIIARALAQESKIILLDEPTSALDIHHQIEILDLLKELKEEKDVTIVAVLHDLNLAARYSEEILLLYEGEVVTIGSTEEVITVENLKKAYNIDMIVERNVYTGDLQVFPISAKNKLNKRCKKSKLLHIVCGGGVGKDIIQSLYEEGYDLSIGVVNIGDSDWEIGRILNLKIAEESPFSEISEEAMKKGSQLATEADAIILTSIPIGKGNLKNLQIVKEQLEQGKTVYFYNEYKHVTKFDYTNGDGIKMLEHLKYLGLLTLNCKAELIKVLKG